MGARLRILAFTSTLALALLSPRTGQADVGIPGEAIVGGFVLIGLAGVAGLTVNILPAVAEANIRDDGSLPGGWLFTHYLAATVDLTAGAILVATAEPPHVEVHAALATPALALGALWGTFAAIRTVKNVERAKRERGYSVQPFSATTRDGGLVVGLAGRF